MAFIMDNVCVKDRIAVIAEREKAYGVCRGYD